MNININPPIEFVAKNVQAAKAVFITATGTEIGKTYYACKLIRQISTSDTIVQVLKPVVSGFNMQDKNSDPRLLIKACNLEFSKSLLEQVSPWRFALPLSPDIAAKKEGRKIHFEQVLQHCRSVIDKGKETNFCTVIEGAGGIMTPIAQGFTMLDLAKQLEAPVILVLANYLGVISHTLTALSALEKADVSDVTIMMNESFPDLNGNELLESISTALYPS